ncbi:MAG: hypothetical protein J0653_04560, partial [Deltaproteobacteria bacterium]|nr:hypothetical protein [Deltaproteobacteria bacterium]
QQADQFCHFDFLSQSGRQGLGKKLVLNEYSINETTIKDLGKSARPCNMNNPSAISSPYLFRTHCWKIRD